MDHSFFRKKSFMFFFATHGSSFGRLFRTTFFTTRTPYTVVEEEGLTTVVYLETNLNSDGETKSVLF